MRQRLYSRAFIIGDVDKPKNRVVFIVFDNLVGETTVRFGLMEALAAAGDEYSMYGQHNVALATAHSHSAPGAWWNYFILQVPTLGFDRQSYQAIVDGVMLSIKRAHKSLQEGYLDVGTTETKDAAINRSLWAYLHNPAEERAKYDAEKVKTMTLLRLQRASDMKNIGLVTWFPVHGTSLYNNTHVAGDNKDLAAWMVDQGLADDGSTADGFVAVFSQANLGDATPNTEGAWCDDGSGIMYNFENATCSDGTVLKCHGRGSRFRALNLGISSCYEIAGRQARAARALLVTMDSGATPVRGQGVKGFHFFHNMKYWKFSFPDGSPATTCPAALGYSFAAGTTDGPGQFDFTQGDSGKPIPFDAGEVSFPYAWEPNIVDIQMLRVGQLVMILSPSEVTTMSGRRWKEAMAKQAATFLDEPPVVVLANPANGYAHYVATPEEYQVQRYEGVSTLYGPNELYAYINLTVGNMHYLEPGNNMLPDQGEYPPDNRQRSVSLIPGVILDATPLFSSFGKVLRQPRKSNKLGADIVATFQGANPRNNLRLEDTFVAIEQQGPNGKWACVRDDQDWFLVYTWRRTNSLLGYSEVDVTWETKGNAELGTYRFKYYGDAKRLFNGVASFEGSSDCFTIS